MADLHLEILSDAASAENFPNGRLVTTHLHNLASFYFLDLVFVFVCLKAELPSQVFDQSLLEARRCTNSQNKS